MCFKLENIELDKAMPQGPLRATGMLSAVLNAQTMPSDGYYCARREKRLLEDTARAEA